MSGSVETFRRHQGFITHELRRASHIRVPVELPFPANLNLDLAAEFSATTAVYGYMIFKRSDVHFWYNGDENSLTKWRDIEVAGRVVGFFFVPEAQL